MYYFCCFLFINLFYLYLFTLFLFKFLVCISSFLYLDFFGGFYRSFINVLNEDLFVYFLCPNQGLFGF